MDMPDDTLIFPKTLLTGRSRAKLDAAGAAPHFADAAVRAMLHASRLGIDSHGFHLAAFYCRMLEQGQVKGSPKLGITRTGPATALIDAGHGLGHHPSFVAIDLACEMAGGAGIGAVGVTASSHNGAAGTYALAGAEAGFLSLSTTNASSAVALHGAKSAFHGTNPIGAAAPVPDSRPWLLDMATSSIPLNRVFLYRTLEKALPADAAAGKNGVPTTDAKVAEMLLPLGGTNFGFKGAGLAGLASVLSAALTGSTPDHEMARMSHTKSTAHRNAGHFFLAIDPARFAGSAEFAQAMIVYLGALRATPAKEGETVMAPGDREWKMAELRDAEGIPIDRGTASFLGL
jgi:ureidoglycolate dehydrogenase (NAD+)